MDQTGAVFPFCICHRVFLQRPSQTVIYQISFALNLNSQLSAMDASVRTTMKGAAKCDKHCKLQNSANQQDFERILRFRDMPESMPASEPSLSYAPGIWARLCAPARFEAAGASSVSELAPLERAQLKHRAT